MSLLLTCFATGAMAQKADFVIKVTTFGKLPAVPYVEKTPQQLKVEEATRTIVPIYNGNALNYYPTQTHPLPLYGNWGVRPIDRYGCRIGDIVIVNAKGVEKRFPIKTDRNEPNARDWDELKGVDCPFEASPKLVNSWIANSRYIVFETSDPGFVAFDFIKGEFVKNLVLKSHKMSIATALDGSIYFKSPVVSTVEQNRFFVDDGGNVLKAPVDIPGHKYAFAFRESYMCQEALSWGENCTHQDQLKRLFAR